MAIWANGPAFAARHAFVVLGSLSLACSGPPQGDLGVFDEPSSGREEQPPLDPLRPGASIVCDSVGPDGQEDAALYVVSAMNHKLRQYPEFAAAAGIDVVSNCEGAQRFMTGYSEYAGAHPGFDADEPLAPLADEESAPPPDEMIEEDLDSETSKIAGVAMGATNNPVVQITFETCSKVHPDGSRCPAAGGSWIVNNVDLRRHSNSCTGTFIAKNWILTAAHCVVYSAIDQCLEKGIARTACQPNWDHYGKWRIQGTINTLGPDGVPSADDPAPRPYDRTLLSRTYVVPNYIGRTLGLGAIDITCDTPGCFNPMLTADHDLALLYVRTQSDNRLPPRVEDDAAKRLSMIPPVVPPAPMAWNLAIAGWGLPGSMDPSSRFLRQTGGPFGTMTVQPNRIDVQTTGAIYPCSGDSGGPVLRTGLTMNTNRGGAAQGGLEAIAAVMSTSTSCQPAVPPPGTTVNWRATLVNTEPHLNFIRDSMNRWPYLQHFSCTRRQLGAMPAQNAPFEVQECWGRPCTDLGPLPNGCAATEYCWNPARGVAAQTRECPSCAGFAAPNDQGCNCIEGQCVPL